MKERASHALALVGVVVVCSGLTRARQDRAEEVLARAREAIGGQARLDAVKSLSAKGSGRRFGTVWLITPSSMTRLDDKEIGITLDIEILLPDKFLLARNVGGTRLSTCINGSRVFDTASSGGSSVPTMFDGVAHLRSASANRRHEFVRYLIAWLLSAPPAYGVRFVDGGTVEIAGEQADLIVAKGTNGFAASLFFNRQARLMMITDQETTRPSPPAPTPTKSTDPAKAPDHPVFTAIQPAPDSGTQMRLADYREDDGILFPHRITLESAGQRLEEWEIARFNVNPSLNPRRFEPR